MTEQRDTTDDALARRYRAASDQEGAAPGHGVRAAILAEARRQAAANAKPAAGGRRLWGVTLYGSLAAAVLAAVIFLPRAWELGPRLTSESAAPAAPAPTAPPPSPSPTAAAAPDVAPVAARARPVPRPPIDAPAPMLPPPAPASPPAPAAGAAASTALAPKQAPTVTNSLAAGPAGHFEASADRVNSAMQEQSTAHRSAILEAVASGDVERVETQLAAGAAIDARDPQGRTALLLATAAGRLDLVQLLLHHGADPNVVDQAGDTALALANRTGATDIATALREAGAH